MQWSKSLLKRNTAMTVDPADQLFCSVHYRTYEPSLLTPLRGKMLHTPTWIIILRIRHCYPLFISLSSFSVEIMAAIEAFENSIRGKNLLQARQEFPTTASGWWCILSWFYIWNYEKLWKSKIIILKQVIDDHFFLDLLYHPKDSKTRFPEWVQTLLGKRGLHRFRL